MTWELAQKVALTLLAILGAWGIGLFFVRKYAVTQIMAGLTIIAGAIFPLIYLEASLVRPLSLFLLSIGQIRATFQIIKGPLKTRIQHRHHKVRTMISLTSVFALARLLLVSLGTLLLLWNYLPRNWIYEGHDLVYFGWIPDLWNISYDGPLVVGLMWPNLMGSNHLVPGLVTFVLGSYWPDFELGDAVALKFILIWGILTYVASSLIRASRNRYFPVLVGVFVALALYGSELAYNLSVSSYLYALLLTLLSFQILWQSNETSDISVLLLLLMLAKAPIVAIAALGLLYWTFSQRKNLNQRRLLPLYLIVGVNYVAFLLAPKGSESASTGRLDLMEIGGWLLGREPLSQALAKYGQSFTQLPGWCLDSLCVRAELGRFANQELITTLVWLLILLKVYLVYFLLRVLGTRTNSFVTIPRNTLTLMDIVVSVSLFSMIFIRNGTTIKHQAHAYLLITVLVGLLTIFVIRRVQSTLLLGLLIFLSALLVVFGRHLPLHAQLNLDRIKSDSALKAAAFKAQPKGAFYVPEAGEKTCLSQVRASLQGQKLRHQPDKDYTCSPLSRFTVSNSQPVTD